MYFNGMSVEENQSLLHLPNSKPNNERESRRYFWHYNVCPCLPSRYAVVAIAFLGFVNVYALRTNLSMAIVAMVNSSANASTHFVSHSRNYNVHILMQQACIIMKHHTNFFTLIFSPAIFLY